MADLTTNYMGLELANPVIAAASGITGCKEGVLRCAEAGAGGVVLKSMFEEIIIAQSEVLNREMIETDHPEAYEYIKASLGMQFGHQPYLTFLEEVRKSISIPVIASINCSSPKWWAPYSRDIENAGACGLELNISHFPAESLNAKESVEKRYIDIVHEVCRHVSIPVAVKLGYYFTSLDDVLKGLIDAGARALVLFNRFYTVDVDTIKGEFIPSITFSSPLEMTIPLRWIGFARERFNCSLAASTGIHDSEGVLKMVMAGADIAQVCSVLYIRGTKYIGNIVDGVSQWLDSHGYSSIADVRGIALKKTKDPMSLLKRLQYIKALNEAATYMFE